MNYNKLPNISYQLSVIQLFSYSAIFLTVLFFALPLKAQVTIGDQTPPHAFSLLELTTAKLKGGLRMPQVTTAQRDTISVSTNTAAQGLAVYNTDTGCVDFWDLTEWVSICNDKPNIAFTNSSGNPADPTTTPFPAAGDSIGAFIPHDNPECTATNPPYTVSVKIGGAYTRVTTTNALNGAFTIVMDTNSSADSRYAIIGVMDKCMKQEQDFIFVQNGIR